MFPDIMYCIAELCISNWKIWVHIAQCSVWARYWVLCVDESWMNHHYFCMWSSLRQCQNENPFRNITLGCIALFHQWCYSMCVIDTAWSVAIFIQTLIHCTYLNNHTRVLLLTSHFIQCVFIDIKHKHSYFSHIF